MSQGIVGQAPHRSTDEERRLLAVADDALRNKEVLSVLFVVLNCTVRLVKLMFRLRGCYRTLLTN